tara:strand:- start:820 stop:1002 length:183 start_codon:yes stop_codon:yes gene_type:complete
MKEKENDIYELMIAIEKFLLNNLNARIEGHESDDRGEECSVEVVINNKQYEISIRKQDNE